MTEPTEFYALMTFSEEGPKIADTPASSIKQAREMFELALNVYRAFWADEKVLKEIKSCSKLYKMVEVPWED